MIFLECERHKWKCWNIQVRENSMSILRDETLRSFNKFKKMYIPVTEANLKGQEWQEHC